MIYNRPRNVDNEWSRWLLQLFHDDIFGMWFPFSLSTRYTPEQLEQLIASRCRWFTNFKVCEFFVFRGRPELTLNYRKRHGYCAFVLPATSYAGTSHFHGLFRVPSRDPSTWVPSTIRQHGQPLTIQMPPALSELFNLYPRDAIEESNTAPSVLGNLHIDNDGHRAIAMDHDSSDANGVLKYWRKRRDGELRDFDRAFFTPHEIRLALPIRTGRTPFPKYVRHLPEETRKTNETECRRNDETPGDEDTRELHERHAQPTIDTTHHRGGRSTRSQRTRQDPKLDPQTICRMPPDGEVITHKEPNT